MLGKIEAAKEMRDRAGLNFQIQLDGQCNESTFRTLYVTGADILIVGSSELFSLAPDIDEAIVSFKEAFEVKTGIAL